MSKTDPMRHIPMTSEISMSTAASKKQMEAASMDPPADQMQANPREFIRLLMENERRIYAYIRTLMGNTADAEDVLQETSMILWDKFSEFDQNSNFVAWSFKIAYFTSQNFRRKQGRSKVVFSNSLFDVIAEKTTQMVPVLDQRHELLNGCIEKLSEPDRKLLRMRYELDASIESTAEQSGRTIQAIYKALSRLRATLFECVNRGMALEGQA
jgi:RNA polymerase sigma-70 factor (ECF subfamily)